MSTNQTPDGGTKEGRGAKPDEAGAMEVRASEARYRRLFESAKDGILILDATTGIVMDVNPFLVNLLGYSHEVFLAKKVWELGFLGDAVANEDMFRELQAKGYVRYEDLPLETSDGRRIEVEFVSNVYLVNEQRVIQCNIRDITCRKQAEAAFRESEKRYRTLVETAAESIFVVQDGMIKFCNTAFCDVTGYTFEAVTTMPFTDMIHPDDQQLVFDRYTQRLEEKDIPSRYTFRFIDTQGNTRWAEISIAVISWEGKPATLCVGSDITEHKQGLELLRESEKMMVDIIEFLPEATLVIDREGTVIAWNKAMENLTGVQADDMLGKGNYEYALPFYGARKPLLIDIALHPELEDHADHTRIYRHGDTLYAELSAPDLSERDVYLAATASVLRDLAGNVIGAIECFRNETERKKLETRLQQSEKMFSLSHISAGVAHEILNPVGIISLELQVIKVMEDLPRKAREEINVCMEQIQRIVAITENLKQFARTTKNVMALDDLNDVIAQVVQMYSSQMKIEDIVTDVKYDASIPPIPLDRMKIEQVLINLFSNAIDAMEGRDEKFLTIQSRRIDTNDGPHAQIVVADRGTGIEEKALRRIFDPFYTTRTQGKGTGMGLSIAHGIISQHDGQIWAENNEWGGTTFFIELPAQREKLHEQKK